MRNLITLLSLVYVTALLSCQESEEAADAKFIILEEISQGLHASYLISDVKEASWLIHYGFSDNDRCRSSGVTDRDKFEQQIKESISKALELWLEPLRELDNSIVDKFTLTLVDTARDSDREKMWPKRKPRKLVESNATPQAKFIFYCQEKDSQSVLLSYAFHNLKEAHLRYDFAVVGNSNPDSPNRLSDERMFMMTSLLHETGHIFGLSDTYVSGIEKSVSKQIDTGDSEFTIGKQPLAIMGIANLLGVHPQNGAFITADDAEGVRWLYHLAHGDASPTECPEDYVVEPETKGCLPRHPFILAVRNRDGSQMKKLLQDSNLDINACDQYGNTALFYAEQYRLRHGGNKDWEKGLIAKGADPAKQCPNKTIPALTSSAEEEAGADTQPSPAAPAAGKTSCGTIRHASVPEHILLLLLALLALLPKFWTDKNSIKCQGQAPDTPR